VTALRLIRSEHERLQFRVVFDEHFSAVCRALRRLGVRESDLDDVAQEVFLAVFKRLDDFDSQRSLRAWLAGFAYRSASNYRRLARHRASSQLDQSLAQGGSSPEERMIALDDRDVLMKALEALCESRRSVLVLHDLEELSPSEISSILNVPLNTVYSRLRTARQELGAAVRRIRGAP
jgi:RNA polymerase sigma-70 factor, ECF subfamily